MPCFEIVLVDVHADHIVMNLLVFGKTYCSATQSLDMGAEVQVLTLNLPGLILAHHVLDMLRRQSSVSTPFVRVYALDWQVGHLAQQFGVALIGAPAVVVGHHPPTHSLDGIPSPTLVGFLAYIRPKLVDFTAVADVDVQFGQFARLDLVDQVGIDLKRRFFLNVLSPCSC